MTVEWSIFLLFVAVVGSAFASGSETALVSASRLKLTHLQGEGRRGATLALGLVHDRDRILAVTLIATNVFNITGGAVATVLFEELIGPLGSVTATVVMTCVFLVLSEIVPKVYFRHHADRMLVASAPIWRALAWLFAPITYPTQLLANLIFRLFHKEPRSLFTSREEIKMMVEESAEEGGLRPHEQEMLESTLDYAETTALEVMVPISEVVLIDEAARTSLLLDRLRERGFTRLPVYRERVDQIVGLVNAYDVLYDEEPKTFIRTYMREIRLVPDTKRIQDLFVEMQRRRERLVAVVNEFGACIGVVSIEDILEEIFGEFQDEHEDATPEVRDLGGGRYRVSARIDLGDLEDETGVKLEEGRYQTLGGYVMHRLGRIPKMGEVYHDRVAHIRIVEADRYGIRTLEISAKEKKEG